MTQIQTLRAHSRLHVGVVENEKDNIIPELLGRSIRVYTNFLVQLVMKLFEKTMTLEIGGKRYLVNKKSFHKHASQLNIDHVANPGISSPSKYVETVVELVKKGTLKLKETNLGDVLSLLERKHLTTAMIGAILNNNGAYVKGCIQRGALLDRLFYIPNKQVYGNSFYMDRVNIESDLTYRTQKARYNSYTPLSLAVQRGFSDIAKMILAAKGGDCVNDRMIAHVITRENHYVHQTKETGIAQVVADETSGLKLVSAK